VANISLKMIEYPEDTDLLNPETESLRKLIDTINDNFMQLMYLIGKL
jgi:hypothetical protein